MKEYLDELKKKEFDCFIFFPEPEDNLHLEISSYKEPGEKIGGSKLGDLYHIILFKDIEEDVPHFDRFEAILSCPITYAGNLIPSGWFGVISKKTSTSDEFENNMYNQITKTYYEY